MFRIRWAVGLRPSPCRPFASYPIMVPTLYGGLYDSDGTALAGAGAIYHAPACVARMFFSRYSPRVRRDWLPVAPIDGRAAAPFGGGRGAVPRVNRYAHKVA